MQSTRNPGVQPNLVFPFVLLRLNRGQGVNILDSYNCDIEILDSLFERHLRVGDRVDLPDGVYTNVDDELAAVIIQGRFVTELELFNSYGEGSI